MNEKIGLLISFYKLISKIKKLCFKKHIPDIINKKIKFIYLYIFFIIINKYIYAFIKNKNVIRYKFQIYISP